MTRPITITLALVCAGCCLAESARADEEPTDVVTTLPYLGDLARQVGGDLVEVHVLAAPGLDPHYIQPTPTLSVTLRGAQVFLENGVSLEMWAERVIDGARNAAIRRGAAGHTYAARGIRPLGVAANLSRAGGDLHPGGNPHVWLDPLNLKHMARNVEQVLAQVRPSGAETFANNRRDFEQRIDEAYFGPELIKVLGSRLLTRLQRNGKLRGFLQEKQYKGQPLSALAGGWLKRALALKDLTVITYHETWNYFSDSFGIRVTGTIEEKPGIPPSPSYLERLEQTARGAGTRIVMCAPYYPTSQAEGVAERLGGVVEVVPTEPGEVDADKTKDVFGMFDLIFDRLEQAAAKIGAKGGE